MTRDEFNALPPAELRVGAKVWIWRGEGRPLVPGIIDELAQPDGGLSLTGWPREGGAPSPFHKSPATLRARL